MIKKASTSSQWVERSLKAVWHPCTQMKHHEQFPLVALSHGQGVWLYDQDGNRYLDAVSHSAFIPVSSINLDHLFESECINRFSASGP